VQEKKTVIKLCKLKKANLERSGIVKVTGQGSVQSLDDNDETDEKEQRRLSLAISKRNNENPCPEKKRIAVSDLTTVAPLAPVTMNVPLPQTTAS